MRSHLFNQSPIAVAVLGSLISTLMGGLDFVVVDAWSIVPSHLIASQSSAATRASSRDVHQLYSTVQTDEVTETSKTKKTWFPVHPADALSPGNDYHSLVQSAYLRHILVETEEMADLILDLYLRGGSLPDNLNTARSVDVTVEGHDVKQVAYGKQDGDVFDRLAHDVSLCSLSREDGGKVGWVDNPSHFEQKNNIKEGDESNDNVSKLNEVMAEMMSPEVIREVFQRRVKGGDVIKLPAVGDDDDSRQRWHLIRVDDLHIQLQPSTSTTSGSKNKINKTRPGLKGSGATPLSPVFQKVDETSNIINNGLEGESDDQSKVIYSVPNAKYYKIATSGCQMNVADSERIMGVLEGELGLVSLDSLNDDNASIDHPLISTSNKSGKKKNKAPKNPDILLLNTCTIRDHAEQKVYDALGPYAALKRAGKPLAIVVAGCVAQQEGEALLRRFPEIDLVLGPQYIPWLGELLVEVGKGSQLCMTESMIWSEGGGSVLAEDGSNAGVGWNSSREKDGDWMVPIKRGHSHR